MKNKLFFVLMLTLPPLYNSMLRILTYDHLSNLRSSTSSIKNSTEFSSTNSSKNHENGEKHEDKFLNAIKQKIKNITKINNKTTKSQTETSKHPTYKVVKLNHQCCHQGKICAYCNSNYCNIKDKNTQHCCFKYCRNCQC
ncbi:uncharacterized protein LOC132944464 isoform X2 [Metopolophium dirhodum]|uniref:uncharacterized protein LOC132944464 isoform X2 n=1 Tax=Metopolophium dirhodum TaxID=44670 RepID=UPI00298F787F|nr:uncharacterized protein LOC132944464 isoform X2 [Metopolophium dirhodum]